MKTLKQWVARFPLGVYFALAYVIAWGGSLLVAAGRGFDPALIGMPEAGLMFLFMIAAASLSGIGLTALLDGRAGLRDLWARMTRWRVGAGWYAVALLTTPVVTLLVLGGLTLFVSPAYTPGFVPPLLFAGLFAGLFEELGWTGFATPRLLRRFNVLTAGLILGLLWAVWHLMAGYWGSITALGDYWLADTLALWIAALVAYRVLMTWAYRHTRSVLLAQLMHAFFSGILGVFDPGTAPAESVVWHTLVAVGMWGLVGALLVFRRADLTRRPA